LPAISTNNFRQALQQTPGLLTSEVANESFASLSFRGLGDPHESYNIQFLQDGMPIAADMFGYPAAYYHPPFDFLDRFEFFRGGSGLLYGPQPGGAINYKSRWPRINAGTKTRLTGLFGSGSFRSGTAHVATNSSSSSAALIGVHHRESNGFRASNSSYRINNASLKFVSELSSSSFLRVSYDGYEAKHGEPGGLTSSSETNAITIQSNRFATTTPNDHIDLSRHFGSLQWTKDFDHGGEISAKLWGGLLTRESFRQSVGTAPTFGGLVNGTTNTIQSQKFSTIATEGRTLLPHQLLGTDSQLTAGVMLTQVRSPYLQKTGETPNATDGTLTKEYSRDTNSYSVFAENRFKIGNFSIVPGFRLDAINQRIEEKQNTGSTVPLRTLSDTDIVFLSGLGFEQNFPESRTSLYLNYSQGYKPVTFTDAVPLSTGDTVSGNIAPARTHSLEAGIRGNSSDSFRYDTSIFAITYDNQFGRVGTNLTNVGGGRHFGWDFSGEWAALSILGGQIVLNANTQLLRAFFYEGPVKGSTPQFAPTALLRGGVHYRNDQGTKVSLTSSYWSTHYADDANTSLRKIPPSSVWDLTGEVLLLSKVSVIGGLYNLFDREYISRIRSNGIEPANPRNFYAGVKAEL
jgi:Fe(3+) dicitrate transport protein